MTDHSSTMQDLYKIQDFLFQYEGIGKKPEYDENKQVYLQVLRLLAEDKGLHFISKELSDPEIKFEDTLNRWNPILTFLISDALSQVEPDKKHKLFSKQISEMTGYEFREYLGYLKEENVLKR
ncbi:hypothetical protein LZG74_12770 [Dyadobacter sp. CY327]|uniref:hypothetical protein n=1 Tax=Dyadobacter sp. CY327 TaxID=2907301 RepID=UPI001F2CE137|nr:hypothetical protein [Dyadobacter sp. CY327]MCE7071185.1 hypothetical protein [Dyadobacter sp. CY327]